MACAGEDCYGLGWTPVLAAAARRVEFERFARRLRRRTQARLRFCSHRVWRWDRDECAGCGWTSFELLAGEIVSGVSS